ncbi:XrtA/PEP-CTERM system exopolysaccharide export protein [Sessilibacter sp. MAH2]
MFTCSIKTIKISTLHSRLMSFLVIASAILISACASKSEFPTPPISETTKTLVDYQIGIGDQLSVSVWRNPDLSVSVPVRPDGKISVPLAGDLVASDKTPSQLAQDITDQLTNYLKNPQVTVIVSDPSSVDFQRRVRITGAVNSPLSIPYRDGMTVLDIVLLANGLNDFAAPKKAKLYRRTEQGVQTYPVNLDDLLFKGKLETNYFLQPSDVLSVPERLF